MSYKVCTQEREIASIIWSVLGTFGYVEAVISDGADCGLSRIALDEGNAYTAIIRNIKNKKAMAEIAAVAVEAALAADIPGFCMKLSCNDEVAELLYLYGLDEYMEISEGEFSFAGFSNTTEIFRSSTEEDLKCIFNLTACAGVLGEAGHASFSETVVFAEKGAEGIAYEVAYTMRLSGCLVKNYLGEGTVEDCEKYASENGISAVIRVHADGKIQIKEMSDGSITETDYDSFANYYNEPEDEDECGCGCGHDHEHKHCDCGCHHED